ncbi:MAG: hypothetical protein J5531_03500, partial [Lachnospiraceae bacterium]|nr:hypothetical protein [Lachnospiraceae bacterium]
MRKLIGFILIVTAAMMITTGTALARNSNSGGIRTGMSTPTMRLEESDFDLSALPESVNAGGDVEISVVCRDGSPTLKVRFYGRRYYDHNLTSIYEESVTGAKTVTASIEAEQLADCAFIYVDVIDMSDYSTYAECSIPILHDVGEGATITMETQLENNQALIHGTPVKWRIHPTEGNTITDVDLIVSNSYSGSYWWEDGDAVCDASFDLSNVGPEVAMSRVKLNNSDEWVYLQPFYFSVVAYGNVGEFDLTDVDYSQPITVEQGEIIPFRHSEASHAADYTVDIVSSPSLGGYSYSVRTIKGVIYLETASLPLGEYHVKVRAYGEPGWESVLSTHEIVVIVTESTEKKVYVDYFGAATDNENRLIVPANSSREISVYSPNATMVGYDIDNSLNGNYADAIAYAGESQYSFSMYFSKEEAGEHTITFFAQYADGSWSTVEKKCVVPYYGKLELSLPELPQYYSTTTNDDLTFTVSLPANAETLRVLVEGWDSDDYETIYNATSNGNQLVSITSEQLKGYSSLRITLTAEAEGYDSASRTSSLPIIASITTDVSIEIQNHSPNKDIIFDDEQLLRIRAGEGKRINAVRFYKKWGDETVSFLLVPSENDSWNEPYYDAYYMDDRYITRYWRHDQGEEFLAYFGFSSDQIGPASVYAQVLLEGSDDWYMTESIDFNVISKGQVGEFEILTQEVTVTRGEYARFDVSRSKNAALYDVYVVQSNGGYYSGYWFEDEFCAVFSTSELAPGVYDVHVRSYNYGWLPYEVVQPAALVVQDPGSAIVFDINATTQDGKLILPLKQQPLVSLYVPASYKTVKFVYDSTDEYVFDGYYYGGNSWYLESVWNDKKDIGEHTITAYVQYDNGEWVRGGEKTVTVINYGRLEIDTSGIPDALYAEDGGTIEIKCPDNGKVSVNIYGCGDDGYDKQLFADLSFENITVHLSPEDLENCTTLRIYIGPKKFGYDDRTYWSTIPILKRDEPKVVLSVDGDLENNQVLLGQTVRFLVQAPEEHTITGCTTISPCGCSYWYSGNEVHIEATILDEDVGNYWLCACVELDGNQWVYSNVLFLKVLTIGKAGAFGFTNTEPITVMQGEKVSFSFEESENAAEYWVELVTDENYHYYCKWNCVCDGTTVTLSTGGFAGKYKVYGYAGGLAGWETAESTNYVELNVEPIYLTSANVEFKGLIRMRMAFLMTENLHSRDDVYVAYYKADGTIAAKIPLKDGEYLKDQDGLKSYGYYCPVRAKEF